MHYQGCQNALSTGNITCLLNSLPNSNFLVKRARGPHCNLLLEIPHLLYFIICFDFSLVLAGLFQILPYKDWQEINSISRSLLDPEDITTYFNAPVVAERGCRNVRVVLSRLSSSPWVGSSLSLESLVTAVSLDERILLRPLIKEAPEGVPVGRRIGVKSWQNENDTVMSPKKESLSDQELNNVYNQKTTVHLQCRFCLSLNKSQMLNWFPNKIKPNVGLCTKDYRNLAEEEQRQAKKKQNKKTWIFPYLVQLSWSCVHRIFNSDCVHTTD